MVHEAVFNEYRERQEVYRTNSGGSFDLILKFWLETTQIEKIDKSILIPKDELVMKFRREMIPQLVVLAEKEQY